MSRSRYWPWLCEFLPALSLRWEFFPFVLVVIPQIWTPPEPSGIQILLLISKGCELTRGLKWWNQSGSSDRREGGEEKSDLEPQGHGWKKEQFEREIPKMTTFIFNNSVFFLEVSKNKGVVVIINMDKNKCQKVHGRVFCLMTQLKKEHEV